MEPVPPRAASSRGRFASVVVTVAVVAVVMALGWLYLDIAAPPAGGSGISTNGMIAMVLGIVLTLALGGGLMALLFFSSRRGYDEQASGRDEPDR